MSQHAAEHPRLNVKATDAQPSQRVYGNSSKSCALTHENHNCADQDSDWTFSCRRTRSDATRGQLVGGLRVVSLSDVNPSFVNKKCVVFYRWVSGSLSSQNIQRRCQAPGSPRLGRPVSRCRLRRASCPAPSRRARSPGGASMDGKTEHRAAF